MCSVSRSEVLRVSKETARGVAPDEAVGPLDWKAAGLFGVTSHFGASSECRTGNSNSTQSRNPVIFR